MFAIIFPAMTPKSIPSRVTACVLALAASAAAETVRLITLAPGHFHAALVQKTTLPGVDPQVHVFAPAGPELDRHLALIEQFNTREDQPTAWKTTVHSGPDYLEAMLKEKPGNLVIISGNNARKSHYILECIKAGLNVLSDKPMAITPEDFARLQEAYRIAAEKKLLLLDIMTERHEITTMLQKELSRFPGVFGELDKGTPEDPSVTKESVHHYSKLVNNAPLQRPPWFYDATQQGEAIVDVTTHLTDLIMVGCFPGEIIRPEEIRMLSARRWPTPITLEQFSKTTRLDAWPDYLKPRLNEQGVLQAPANGEFTYTLRGVHAKVSVKWEFEAPAGAGDTHDSLLRGTRAALHIRQGAEQEYKPVLYIEPRGGADAEWRKAFDSAMAELAKRWPGLEAKESDGRWHLIIPDQYKAGHEAHFGKVTERFLGYLAGQPVPDWEVPNTLVKYHTLMEAWRMSQ